MSTIALAGTAHLLATTPVWDLLHRVGRLSRVLTHELRVAIEMIVVDGLRLVARLLIGRHAHIEAIHVRLLAEV